MRFKLLTIFFTVLFNTLTAYAQDENEYSRETVVGVNLNTNGGLIGGAMFRHTREIGKTRGKYFNYGAELVVVKHPNEVRTANSYTGNVFILGKKNYLFALRPHVGYEFLLFNKGKEDGIQVDAIFNFGPTIGFVKPYYIQYDDGVSVQVVPYSSQYYDPATKGAGIVGSGGFFRGFDHMKIVPGAHMKAGMSFEFGTFGSGVSGIEAGTLLEVYPKRIELMDISSSFATYNRWFFSSLYVNIYFGGRR
ncbi:MAG TPA: hypothetical protein VNB90_05765 [Cytophagaceae bacterium]|nr:hypothetical protein [Cytophagaceae bacterium]